MTSNPSKDEQEIRHLIEKWAKAVRDKNVAAILADHSPDILMFDVPPPFESRGMDAYKKTWDLFFAESQYAGMFDIQKLDVTAGDDVAFATASMRCGAPEINGKKTHLDFRLTVGLRKIKGRWTVTHEHHSVPAS
jgi:uncharacterized protein (TIGR02246 family)